MQTTRRRFLEGSATGIAATGLGAGSLGAQDGPARRWINRRAARVGNRETRRPERGIVRGLPAGAGEGARDGRHPRDLRNDRLGESVADEFAAAGYLAIAPDLLSGMAPNGGRTKDLPANAWARPSASCRPTRSPRISTRWPIIAGSFRLPTEGLRGGLLVGRRTGVPLRHHRKDLSLACVFYGNGPAPEAIPNIQAPRLRFLCGDRYAHRRHCSGHPGTDESGAQVLRAGDLRWRGARVHARRSAADATTPNKNARAAAWVKLKALRDKS